MSLSSTERDLLQLVGRLIDASDPPLTRPCSEHLAERLRRHHLRPLSHLDGVQGLEGANRECAVIAAFHHQTLSQVGRVFDDRAIAWTTIKGAAYAWTLYETPELRPMSDLDLLVQGTDFERACEALVDAGFSERTVSVRTRHAQTFTRAPHEIIDLHRDILQPMRGHAGMARAWERAQRDSFLPGYWRLAQLDLCWIHIAHMARHEFVVPLIAYVDLQRLLGKLSASENTLLSRELKVLGLDYSLAVSMSVSRALRSGNVANRNLRMRLVMPSLEELLRGRHRARSEQIAKKLALFPRACVALGVGWALRVVEDQLTRGRFGK